MKKTWTWLAEAEYSDGTSISKEFPCDIYPNKSEDETQYLLEAWLIERHVGCTWYSVSPYYTYG